MPGGRSALAVLPAAPISVDGFDGSLELLLHLLDEGQLEVTAVSLAAVADQYLSFVRVLPPDQPRLDFLSEFLVVGARLLLLKSRALLPPEAVQSNAEEVLDEASLEARLAEYRRYRQAADRLRERDGRGERAFARQAPPPYPPRAAPPHLDAADPAHLARALQRLLDAKPPHPEPPAAPRVSLAERLVEVRAAVAAHVRLPFAWLIESCPTRADLIITFLAILELYRASAILLAQDELFGEIWLAAS